MLRITVCVLFGILGASGLTVQPIFTFKTLSSIFRRNYDDCKICYGNHDCLSMDKARCEYYMEVEDVLQKTVDDDDEEIPEMVESVDALLFDLAEKASDINKECIPFISEYTDCTRENVCTGCKRCSCDAHGEWNCTIVQRCRADDILNVDHKVLVSVMERLNNIDLSNRKKRSIMETPHNVKKITYDEISEWLYNSKPIRYDNLETEPKEKNFTEDSQIKFNDEINVNNSDVDTVHNTRLNVSEHQADIDYLAFDEVLNNIAVDTKNYSRRKPPLDVENNKMVDIDHMIIEDINITTKANGSDQFMNMLNEIEEFEVTELPPEGTTKVFIDLLESGKKYIFTYNETDYMNVDTKLNNEFKPFDNTNNIDELNLANIMKREISNASYTTENIDNNTESFIELKDKVLQPLADIISGKEKELQELHRVKENLMTFMKTLNNDDIELNFKDNRTEPNSNSYFSIYKMEIIPQFDYDLRKKNPEVIDKHLYKLKRDIYEVIKDIVGIKKLSDGNLPEELKVLIRAMKYYIRKDKKGNKTYKNKNIRRQYNTDMLKPSAQSIKDCVIDIFELLDKDMPEANALSPISQTAKKILRRIIRNNYFDEFVATGLKFRDLNYNLTNNLSIIGDNWQQITENVVKSSLHDRSYAMKLFYLTLSVDISKLTDILTLMDFAHSRQSYDPYLGKEMIKSIHTGLQNINNKIKTITRSQNESKQIIFDNKSTNEQKVVVEKDTFLKQLRKLFRNNKSDIEDLLKKNVPKSEIVKAIAKKKLSDLTRRKLTEYEEVMKRWQYNLDLLPKRYKRSSKDRKRMKNRIKNIIPKYLRGKINPAMVSKNSMKGPKKGKTKKYTEAIVTSTIKSGTKTNNNNYTKSTISS